MYNNKSVFATKVSSALTNVVVLIKSWLHKIFNYQKSVSTDMGSVNILVMQKELKYLTKQNSILSKQVAGLQVKIADIYSKLHELNLGNESLRKTVVVLTTQLNGLLQDKQLKGGPNDSTD